MIIVYFKLQKIVAIQALAVFSDNDSRGFKGVAAGIPRRKQVANNSEYLPIDRVFFRIKL